MKPSTHTNEKFLLFFLVSGEEIPFFQMVQNSLVERVLPDVPEYTTHSPVAKLFVSQQGFGVPKRFYSFYFRFKDHTHPRVTIRPFSRNDTGMYFTGRISFLKKSEAMELLADGNQSKMYLRKQLMLPVEVLRSLITVDRDELREGLRHVRICRKRKLRR